MPFPTPQYPQNLREQFMNNNPTVGWPRKLFTFAVVIFASMLLIYTGLAFGYRTFLTKSIEGIDDEIKSLSARVTEEQRENLTTLYSQTVNMRKLLDDHVFSSKVFTLLESITYPKVAYISSNLNVDSREMSITGVTVSYEDLATQLALIENSPQIEKYNLDSSEWDSGVVQFRLNLKLVENMFHLGS
jgi:hypothetical protein